MLSYLLKVIFMSLQEFSVYIKTRCHLNAMCKFVCPPTVQAALRVWRSLLLLLVADTWEPVLGPLKNSPPSAG